MKRLWADILDADGDVTGVGPIDLTSASVGRGIDAASSLRIAGPADVRARELVRAGRSVRISYEDDEGEIVVMGEGVINTGGLQGSRFSADGKDLLEELTRRLTMPNQTASDLVGASISSLIFDAGWTVAASGDALTQSVSELFDEPKTLLNAIITIAEHSGTHIRLSSTSRRVLEVGNFGEANDLTLIDGSTDGGDSEQVGILAGLSISEQAGQLANWIIPVGADMKTIADSTRPEKRSLIGPDGNPVYYLADDDSITEYGLRQIYETFPDLKPRSASAADSIACANQICIAGLSTLAKRRVIRYDYRGRVLGLKTFLKPGDSVRCLYNEPIFQDDGSIWPGGALDAQLYIIRVDVVATETDVYQNVELSNINALREDITTELVTAVERSKKVS